MTPKVFEIHQQLFTTIGFYNAGRSFGIKSILRKMLSLLIISVLMSGLIISTMFVLRNFAQDVESSLLALYQMAGTTIGSGIFTTGWIYRHRLLKIFDSFQAVYEYS